MRSKSILILLIGFVMVLLVGSSQAAPLSDTHQRIADIVVEEVLGGRTTGVRVVATPFPLEEDAGYEFLWSGGSMELPPGTVWFAVADEYPGVLGYHPVRHVFMDRDLSIIDVRDATFYPRFYRDGERHGLTTLVAFHASPGKVPADREPAVVQPGAEDSPRSNFSYNDFYAVLIEGDVPSGDTYSEFWTDNVRMFRILLEYGFDESHIYVLYGEGQDETDWYCEALRENMVDFPAYKQDVRNLFTWMKDGNAEHGINQVTSEDFIFLFSFDHGGSSGGCDATLCMMDGCMPDTEFASYFNPIAYKHRAVDMQQCHSGGFVDDLENTLTVVSTASNCTESAYEADEQEQCDGHPVKFGEWNYWWMSAMEGHLPWPNLAPVDADTNLDGMISFLEAHNYALANDDRSEHPMWSDLGGIGDDLSLNTTWEGAHLVHIDHSINDDGNLDGIADVGESIVMPVTLQNIGEQDAVGITSSLTADSSWVAIQDGEATYPDLPAQVGVGESLPDHYQWSSDPATPDNTKVRFKIDWTAGGGAFSGNAQFYETLVKVILDMQQVTVEDQDGGDGDGVADAGESIHLAVTLRNKGHADAHEVSGILFTSSPYAVITDDASDFEDIPGAASGRSIAPHFGLDIAPGTPDGTWIECTLDITAADGYSISLPLRFMVGSRGAVLLVEDGDPGDADVLELLIGQMGFGVERDLAADTDPDSWNMYDIVVWASGGNADPVADAAWRDALEQHVADGGKLLIEGGEIGYDHRNHTSFRENVLHMSSWSAHGGGDLHVNAEDHPLTTVPTVMDEELPLLGAGNSEKDAVVPVAGATLAYDWTTQPGRASVIGYDDDELQGNGGQVVSFFSATDVIGDTAGQRRSLIENMMEWLMGNDKPYLLYDGHTVIDDDANIGNGNGVPDPGEIIHLAVNLKNEGAGTATGVWVRGASDHPLLIEFIDNYASWPMIPSGATAASDSPHLELRIDPATPCGTVIEVTLDITTAEGYSVTRRLSFKVGVGGGVHSTYNSTDTPVAIPNPGTVESVLDIQDLFRIGDIQCHVEAHHSSTTLISITLRSPEGTEVVLHDGEDYGTALNTTYDSPTLPHGPGSMSDFDGEVGQGEWKLAATDSELDLMMGELNTWSIIIDTDDMCYAVECEQPLPGPVEDTLLMSRTTGCDTHLEWGAVPGAAGYRILRSDNPGMTDEETVGNCETTIYEEVGLPNTATVYYYQVVAENDCLLEGP